MLSLGGKSGTYQLTGEAEGIAFANFLWGAFGPRTDSWVNASSPRPFDIMVDGKLSQEIVIGGFDFDIEVLSTGKMALLAFSDSFTNHFQIVRLAILLSRKLSRVSLLPRPPTRTISQQRLNVQHPTPTCIP